jgi:predicted glycoside hydrolase/deacetylase ChbG (UPF0249 family)
LKESREEELKALVAPEVKAALERLGVELVDYRGIAVSDQQSAAS